MQSKQTITQNVAVVLTANEAAEYYCRSRESDKNNKQVKKKAEMKFYWVTISLKWGFSFENKL